MTISEEVVATPIEAEYYVNEEGAEPVDKKDDAAVEVEEEGMAVQSGHVVPAGVAVEELKNYGGHKKLRDECPETVQTLMNDKGLFDVYDRFVGTIAKEKKTRGPLGKWRESQVC